MEAFLEAFETAKTITTPHMKWNGIGNISKMKNSEAMEMLDEIVEPRRQLDYRAYLVARACVDALHNVAYVSKNGISDAEVQKGIAYWTQKEMAFCHRKNIHPVTIWEDWEMLEGHDPDAIVEVDWAPNTESLASYSMIFE